MTLCCPICLDPVQAKPGAAEGRHVWCRPHASRRHSDPRSSNWTAYLKAHNQQVHQ